MSALPAEIPKIDWAAYKNKIAVPGLVDSFEKSYSTIKVPYPEDKYTGAIDKNEQETVIINSYLLLIYITAVLGMLYLK